MNAGNLNKTAIVLIAIGGVAAVLAGVLGWFYLTASSATGEAQEELEVQEGALQRAYAAKPFPSEKSVRGIRENTMALSVWYETAFGFASRGDRPATAESAPVFKQRLSDRVRELVKLPAGAEKKICGEKFLFGFEKYLGESAELPAAADVPKLADELDLISFAANVFADASSAGFVSFDAAERKAGDASTCVVALKWTAKPAAIVKVLNAFAEDEKFVTVKDFTMRMTSDPVSAKFSAADKKGEASGGRRSRRARRAEPVEAEKKAEDPLFTDPARDAVYQVETTLELRDFGTQRAKAEADEGAGAEGKKSSKKKGKKGKGANE